MKLRKDYVMQQLMDEYLVIPVGEAGREFRGTIRMNETGKFMWDAIGRGADTKEKVMEELRKAYAGLNEEEAREDLELFLRTVAIAIV